MDALLALWDGAFGSSYAFWSATLVRATPLVLVGLAVALAFRAGVLNIGAEGQLVAGAIVATALAQWLSAMPRMVTVPAMALGGMIAGAAWAGIAATMRRRFGVLEVISTLMLPAATRSTSRWIASIGESTCIAALVRSRPAPCERGSSPCP